MIWNLLEVLDFLSGEIQIIWGFDLETSRKFAKLSGRKPPANLAPIWKFPELELRAAPTKERKLENT
jgi:hypothetical protein